MTLSALENALIKFNACIEKWEAAGHRGCEQMHDCRTVAQAFTVHVSCVKRAVELVRQGKTEEALRELGDYIIST
jgi:hypothetical protein